MLTRRIKMAVGAALVTGAVATATPAAAGDVSVGIRIGRDFALVFNGDDHRRDRRFDSYAYSGYQSGYWYTNFRPAKRRHWNTRYRAFDCHPAFKYGYFDGRRARIEAVMCYNSWGDFFIVPGSRYVVALHDGRYWGRNRRWVDDRRWDYSRRWNDERYRWQRERDRDGPDRWRDSRRVRW